MFNNTADGKVPRGSWGVHRDGLAAFHQMPIHHDHFAVLQMKYLAVIRLDGAVDFNLGAIRHRDFVIHRGRRMAGFHHHHFSAIHHHAVHVSGGRRGREQRE